ncbi:hypothetical protein CKAH01_04092 [Colletotrichum kahawae]|uniref:Uncharacterized protein n=1 Tax=Colletotrichum kahawae TaxID=34407 RepID=A0AAE0DCQ3_COLKA|nr:hypothetical protein CKAH01_04092 [Colletotrichum kahawae]
MSSEKTKKTAAKTKTSAATADSTTTGGRNTKRKNAETPGSINKKQKTKNAGEGEPDSEEGEADVKGDGDKKNKKDKITCLVRPDEAWRLVEESHKKKKPDKSYKRFLETESYVSKITKEEVDEIIPPVISPTELPESLFNEYWTHKDEEDLRTEWFADPERAVLMDISGVPSLIMLWKLFLRLFRKSPAEVISAKHALRYDPDEENARKTRHNKDVKRRKITSPLWSEIFMGNLISLAHHPLWQGNVDYLIVAIQYAVIVRTNDCRTWRLLNPPGDEFFNTMIRVIEEHKDEGMDLPGLHKIAREDMQKRGIRCCWFSQFMEKLEGRYMPPPPKQTGDDGPYMVSAVDLQAILKALTDMDYHGIPLFRYTGEGYGKEAGKIMMRNDLPYRTDLGGYHERSIFAERRWVAIQKKLADRERPVKDSTGSTVSAEATGSGSGQTEIDQLKEVIEKLEDEILESRKAYKQLQQFNPVPSSDALEDPDDN